MTKSLFIHIPKTGGRSILAALGIPWSSAHRTIAEIENEQPEALSDEVFKFTVVRNPWDRAVSMWMFFGQMSISRDVKPFEEWLTKIHARYAKEPNMRIRPTVSQSQFCVDSKGNTRIDRFLRFENLAADFDALASKVTVVKPLPKIGGDEKLNTIRIETDSDKKLVLADAAMDYHAVYTDKLVEMVRDIDGWTADQFGYSFSDAAPPISKDLQDQITLASTTTIRLPISTTPGIRVVP